MDFPRRGQRQRQGHEPPPPSPSTAPNSRYSNFEEREAVNVSYEGGTGFHQTQQHYHNHEQHQQTQQNLEFAQPTRNGMQQPRQEKSEQIASLLQFAHSSYHSHPTDALSALMEALTLTNGTNAAQEALDRIRFELGNEVANCVARHPMNRDSQFDEITQNNDTFEEKEVARRAIVVIEQMMDDTSTILHAQGRQHILQQAMEDGSSVVCPECGDMVKADRWSQHSTFWCRGLCNVDDKEMDG